MEYQKDFNTWNNLKQNLDKLEVPFYIHTREIWWCSLGVNIGAEIDGKNNDFERPVILIKVYNKDTILILPIISESRKDRFHHTIQTEDKPMYVRLTQTRTISSKRLIRRIGILDDLEFTTLVKVWKDSI